MDFIEGGDLRYDYTSYDDETNEKKTTQALKGVDISIKKGEFVALLGHNGSGKSTLAKLLNGINMLSGGTLYIKGLDASDENNIWDIRQSVGMVFQNPDNQIIASIVEEDVAFGPENLGIAPADIVKNVDMALKAVRMEKYRLSSPSCLSGGQKQRIAIAGILAMKPECIVLDEATAMLDPLGRQDIMNTVMRLNREDGITVVLITHYMEEAALADRVIVINEGRIADEGKPSEIFAKVEKMRSLRLDVPQITELSYIVNKKIKAFPADITTIDGFVSAALKIGFKEGFSYKKEKKRRNENTENIIEVKNLTHIYAEGSAFESTALKNVSLEIKKGDFVGLIGHTGSGKSTLIQHFNALEKADEGRVFFKGEDINADKSKLKSLRQKIGLVFQYPEHQIFGATIFEEVAFGPSNCGLPEDEIKRRVKKALSLVGIDESMCERSPFDLSGGQKRRIAIAGVLAMEPEVLVLDEPMAGLDPRGRDEILSNIKKMHDELGITIVLVSHSMEAIAEIADSIIVMSEGSVEMYDTCDNVFSQAERLRAIGLDVPCMTQLFARLRSEGLDVPENIYSVKEGADILISALRV